MLKVTSINQLMKGEYNGTYTLSQLTSQGDLGLGTFHQLDGEMIILHGICYKNQERSSDIYS